MAIAHVQSQSFDTAGGYTEFLYGTPSSPITAGNFVVIIVSNSGDNLDTMTMTTDKGDTVVSLLNITNTVDQSNLRVWYIENAVGGSTQFQLTSTVPEYRLHTMIVREFSGIADSSVTDGTPVSAAINAYGQTFASGTLTTTNADDLIIGAVAVNNEVAVLTSQTGQSWTGLIQDGSNPYSKLGSHYKIVASAGGYASQFESADFMTGVSAIMAFKAAAAAPPANVGAGFFQIIGMN